MAFAFVTRDVLRLRALLVAAQALVVVYTWLAGVPVIAAWNVLYVSVNAWMAIQLLQERRAVTLPADLRRLYDRHFSALSPGEFLRWWALGERTSLDTAVLARSGERPDWLYFLLDGRVRVSRGGETVTELPAGYFVGEMSLLTDRPANADVESAGPVVAQRWPRTALAAIRDRDPKLWTRIQSVIGHDLVEKIHRAGRSAGA
jgi:CRP-like cAMP-binding protein